MQDVEKKPLSQQECKEESKGEYFLSFLNILFFKPRRSSRPTKFEKR